MRVCERTVRVVGRLAAIAFMGTLCCLGSRSVADDFEDSWNEKLPPTDESKPSESAGSSKPSGGPTPLPPASPLSQVKSGPAPTPRAPLDPKKFASKNDFACQQITAKANQTIANIEAKRDQEKQGHTVAEKYPLESEYDAAYKQAVDELKQKNPKATDADLDAAGKKAGREAVQKGFGDGKVVDPKTGESEADLARREFEGASRGKPVPPPSNAVPANASPYMKECAKNGVPLPPVWGDPKWVKQGTLSKDKGEILAFDFLPTADVFVSKSPLGVCYALPRMDEKGVIQRLDQICQSEQTGKACFWDNTDPKDGYTPVKVVDGLDPANVSGGDKMKMNCTRCHRGDNAFIIHPNTPLQLGPTNPCEKNDPTSKIGATDPAKRFQPIGRGRNTKISKDPEDQAGFENPTDEFASQGTGPCTACHSIPKLTYSYCGMILVPMMNNGEMPPKPPPPAPTPKMADYKKDIDTLTDACLKVMNENAAP